MKKIVHIVTMSFAMAFCSSSFAGPFGIEMNWNVHDFKKHGVRLFSLSEGSYVIENPPQKNRAFDFYLADISRNGVCSVTATGKIENDDSYGTRTKSKFLEIANILKDKYGAATEAVDILDEDALYKESSEWMKSIQQGERKIMISWKNEPSLPKNVDVVRILLTSKDAHTGKIILTYKAKCAEDIYKNRASKGF